MSKIRFVLAIAGLALASACGTSTPSAPTVFNPSPTPTPTPSGNAVSIVSGAQTLGSRAYSPNPITVSVGTSVTWTNGDAIAHTVTSDTRTFDSSLIPAGGTFTVMFQNAGTFPYHCTIHPGMVGSVVVQ
jgi:plastocyanin